MSRSRGLRGSLAGIAAAALAGVSVPGAQATVAAPRDARVAAAGWSVTTLAGGRQAWLLGVAALPGGGKAVLLDERQGRDHRLVLYRNAGGTPTNTLMTSVHSFAASLGADARGNVAVAWYTIPNGASHRQAYFWAGRRVIALTDGTRHAADALAVAPDGHIAVAVSESSPGGGPARVSVRRSAFGGRLRSVEVGDLQYLYPNALALGPSGAVALGGAVRSDAGAFTSSLAVSVSRSVNASFLPATKLAPATVPAPNVPLAQGPTVGFGPEDTLIAATNTLKCLVGTGDLSEPCSPGLAGSTLQVWLWPPSDAGLGAPIRPSKAHFAYLPVVVTSGPTTWLAWYEGATNRMDTLAVAKVAKRRLGTVRRLRLAAAEQPGSELPIAAPAPGSALRFYLPATTKQSSALHTVVMSPTGRFGTTSTVVRGTLYAGPNTRASATPSTGLVRDLVGWTSWDDRHGAHPRIAHP